MPAAFLWAAYGGDAMSTMAAVETQICETYEGLLEECETARREWNQRRAEISELGLRGKGIDDELRWLQARFAKSYAMARNHLRDCGRCQSAGGTDHTAGDESHGRVFAEFRDSSFSSAQFTGV
jgi:hypothetical protein